MSIGDDDDLKVEREREEREYRDANDDLPSDGWQGEDDDEPAPRREDDRDDGEGEPQRPKYGSPDEDMAEAIAAKQVEDHLGRSREYDDDPSRTGNFLGSFDDGEDDPQPAGEPQRQAAPLAEGEEQMVETIVRGQKVMRPLSEVIAAAQKNEAADSYIADARRMFDEAKAELTRIREGGAPRTEAQHREAERGMTEEQREQYRNAHEVMTYGTPEEIDQFFAQRDRDLVERAKREIRGEEIVERRKQEFKASTERGRDYVEQNVPDLAGHQHLTDALMMNVTRAQREAMAIVVENLPDDQRQAFYRNNVTPDRLRAMTSPLKVAEAYRNFHLQGYTLPSMEHLFKVTADYTAERAGIQPRNADPARTGRPTTQGEGGNRGRVQLSEDRHERKRELTPQTPRASAGPGRTSAPREQSERDFHKSAMADYREQAQGIPRRR